MQGRVFSRAKTGVALVTLYMTLNCNKLKSMA